MVCYIKFVLEGVVYMTSISYQDYYDKVYACWLGKNCGGTLGTPVEKAYGQEEMFDVWWYPVIKEGGMPNDDLEIQLIWLKALEDKGPAIKARDLAQYWQDSVNYNFDEYGLNKTNLRLGLMPPVSGYYNNWFKNCMGCPIRSEIWACVAPGNPNIAVKYAYEDAIIDHAGGESIYGEMFNAAVEAAAFVIADRDKLLEIGLSYIPQDSKTAVCIKAAIEAFKKGMDWKDARNYVLNKSFSKIAQYSPVNLGFEIIGWLYGKDFADAICKAVNCGYDTDCTGATLGSILGIMYGTKIIPKKWSDPLSDKITTNSSWGGIINLKEPADLSELTARTCAVGKKMLSYYDADMEIDSVTDLSEIDSHVLYAGEYAQSLWKRPATFEWFDLNTIEAGYDYIDSPVIKPGENKQIKVKMKNTRPMDISLSVELKMPRGFDVMPESYENISIKSGETAQVDFTVRVNDIGYMRQSNRGTIHIDVKDRPQAEDIPFVLISARKWLVSPLNAVFDENGGNVKSWQPVYFDDNEIKAEPCFEGKDGTLCFCHYVYSENDLKAHIGVSSNCDMEFYINSQKIHEAGKGRIPRPNYAGDGSSYADADFRKGWNSIVVKLKRDKEPVEAYLTLSTVGPYFHGLSDISEYCFPWESRK